MDTEHLFDNIGVILRIGHCIGVFLIGSLLWLNKPFKVSSEIGMFTFICLLFSYLIITIVWGLIGSYSGYMSETIYQQLRQVVFNGTVGLGVWIWLLSIVWPILKKE